MSPCITDMKYLNSDALKPECIPEKKVDNLCIHTHWAFVN